MLLMRQTSKLSCADGMNWGEKWDKATNCLALQMGGVWHFRALFLYSWKFQAWQVQNYVSFQHDFAIPWDFSVTYKTMNNCSTGSFHNACNILNFIQHTLQKQLPSFTPGWNKVRLYQLEYSFVVKVEQTQYPSAVRLGYYSESVLAWRCEMPSASFHVSREVQRSARCLACYKA